ncbi:hypothetical protein L6164_023437 [Bauhinia variegata]|uniref:Uncharacterized protein n=1 Tax=Bauhinia variegata TaxID=167791 RepID=A0ACB9MI78_BAUVA|nr:hypothetical protein L6164_023437 [Bauhinia variegata]
MPSRGSFLSTRKLSLKHHNNGDCEEPATEKNAHTLSMPILLGRLKRVADALLPSPPPFNFHTNGIIIEAIKNFIKYLKFDINECNVYKPCVEKAICFNEIGSYSCKCPEGFEGNGLLNGTGCERKSSSNTFLVIALSVSLSFVALLVGSFYVYWGMRKRRVTNKQEGTFF